MRHRTTARMTAATLGAATLALGLAACADGGDGATATETTTVTEGAAATSTAENGGAGAGAGFATAALQTADGDESGTVTFAEDGGRVTVTVEARDLEPGFRGFHIHGNGQCEPDSESPDGDTGDFMSAGGHLAGDADAEGHGNPDGGTGHAGDMPPLLVGEDGTASMTFTTDRLTRDLLLDDDGSAVIVHSDADNFAHVPDRYADDGADEDSMKTGDAGDRTLCGVVEESEGGAAAGETSETTETTEETGTETDEAGETTETTSPAEDATEPTTAEETETTLPEEN